MCGNVDNLFCAHRDLKNESQAICGQKYDARARCSYRTTDLIASGLKMI